MFVFSRQFKEFWCFKRSVRTEAANSKFIGRITAGRFQPFIPFSTAFWVKIDCAGEEFGWCFFWGFEDLVNDLTEQIENPAIKIYPNPVTDLLYFESQFTNNEQFEIFDLRGRKIKSGKISGNTVNVSRLQNGMYVLKILGENLKQVTRFVKY